MAKQKIVRVDYRLIHGQVVAKWIKYYPVNRIIVADDDLKNDDFMCDIYKMAAPGNMVEIVTLAELAETLNKKNDEVMIIFKDIKNVQRALKNGVELIELNVGAVQTGKDSQFVTSGVALTKEEVETLQEMHNDGLNVYVQPIPENERLSIESIMNKIK
ncbi:PTS sugar transporter subunit IIB [Enterococcus raffinosus]|uniref:PTS sugar transporter subunit IIB n=1 Tax=Enterococcus raffinosus TaxID=71452 RepID=A0AAW8T3X5_9ENTE|nr:PTS sugar transporter subunit IIB [Enterococcus raffinosus]MDT2522041.1 PTS sugar transporter subunit IIB [Enterococcus raffinosus]MDT2528385.1 PTS sugar transporter subunit IIB [Enterococcus raffinosus]MDT2533148.1 PTS sugar transporter subunit IIB [Enterococcus raffinosus]MDT2543588.1 PTS sugar transporter subunit IIB [Enterococcus raffinosus]MDT2553702.1 PTS sugar transporter subunit IIB [Enterococcus raffinosus]